VNTGKWPRLTSSQQFLKEPNDVLCGIIFFFDCPHVANKEKLSLCPLMFTLSIITRYLRNQPFAWRPLGYFPRLLGAKKLGQNVDTLHRFLDVFLLVWWRLSRMAGLRLLYWQRMDGSLDFLQGPSVLCDWGCQGSWWSVWLLQFPHDTSSS
jgi:hypothetical protein